MKKEFLLRTLGDIDPACVAEAEVKPKRRFPRAARWGALAACVVLIAAFPLLWPRGNKEASYDALPGEAYGAEADKSAADNTGANFVPSAVGDGAGAYYVRHGDADTADTLTLTSKDAFTLRLGGETVRGTYAWDGDTLTLTADDARYVFVLRDGALVYDAARSSGTAIEDGTAFMRADE